MAFTAHGDAVQQAIAPAVGDEKNTRRSQFTLPRS
jgi:hypothetical protein